MCADQDDSARPPRPPHPARPPRPPRPVRLLVCDLDGTLIDEHGAVVAGLPETLVALDKAGVPLILCTGRPHVAARRLAAAAGLRPALIASYHGALLIDERTGRWRRHLAIPGRCASGIADLLSACGLELTYYAGTDVWPAGVDPPERVTRLIAIGAASAVDAALERSGAIAGSALRIDRPTPTMLDVRHRLATKDEGLRAAVKALDVPLAAVVAAGDDASDAAMLQLAGWGVVVGAPPTGSSMAHAGDVVVAQRDLTGYLRSLLD